MGFLHTPLELDELARAGPATGRRTESTAAERLLGLQATAGNRAVTEALQRRFVQRAPPSPVASKAQPPTTRGAAPKGDAEEDLDAVLARIAASMKLPERVAPMEVITATTAAEFSTGELDLGVEQLWKRERLDFTKAARKSVATPAKGGAATGTRSPQLDADRRYGLRRSVSLLAADYKTGGDLGEVAAMARKGSPYRSALTKEFGEPTIVLNPTGARMRNAIFDAILKMWIDLGEGDVGELVVTFSGHGGGGFFSGVDWVEVSGDELESLANLGADYNVHVVYVMDTCRAGLFVGSGQGASIRDLKSRIDQLAPDKRKALQARVAFLRSLATAAQKVGTASHHVGSAARDDVRRHTDANRLAYFGRLVTLSKETYAFGDVLKGTVPAGTPDLKPVIEAREQLGWSTIAAMAGSGREVPGTLHAAARMLDAANDVINGGLEQLDGEIRAQQKAGGARAGGGSGATGRR